MKHRAFAQTCKTCRKSRPLGDFTRPGSTKVNKTCLECLDACRAGKEPDVAPPGLGLYLPVVIPPEARTQRRWWPSWVHAKDPAGRPLRLNPRGADELRSCAHCGVEYTSRNQQQRFCSRRCKSAWHRPGAKAAREAARSGKT